MSLQTMGESTRARLAGVVRAANADGGGGGGPAGVYVGGYGGGAGGTWGKAATGRGGPYDSPAASPVAAYKGGGAASPPAPAYGGGAASPYSVGGMHPPAVGGMPNPYAGSPNVYSSPQQYNRGTPRSPALAAPYAAGGVMDHNGGMAGGPPMRAAAAGVREKIRPASAGVKQAWDLTPRELPRAPHHASTNHSKVRPRTATLAKSRQMPGLQTVEYKMTGTGLAATGRNDTSYSTYNAYNAADRNGGGGGGGGGGGASVTFAGDRVAGRGFDPSGMNAVAAFNSLRGGVAATGPTLVHEEGESDGNTADWGPVTEAELAALEDAIRDAVREKRSVYEGSKEMLLRLFKAVDDGSGDVSLREFINVCSALNIRVLMPQAQALFRRFGCVDVMPYAKFSHTLLTQPSRQLAEDMPTRKGAFEAGQSANFNGKIIYPHCRKPVYTPSDWDPALAARSAELPNARLVLEYVYGYQGKDATAQNLFYTSTGQVVYFVAGVAIVYSSAPSHTQHYFLGHTDDIKSLALCPAAVTIGAKQYPAKTIVATGQVTSHEAGPLLCIWDSRVTSQQGNPELVKIQFDKDARGLSALAFSPDGTKLVAVATDNAHTIYIYDWRKQRVLGSGRGQMGDPPQVYGVEWCPYEESHGTPQQFVTFGKKHIKLWTSTMSTSTGQAQWGSKQMSCGKFPMQHIHCAQWLVPKGHGAESLVVAGTGDGQLYLFKGAVAVRAIAAHRPGPSAIQPDGHVAYVGMRGLRLCKSGTVLLSGGVDGMILQWDVADGSLQESRMAGPPIAVRSAYGDSDRAGAVVIRSLDYSEEKGTILVGTGHCDVLEVTETEQVVLTYGHSADVWDVTFHPTRPNLAATAADNSRVYLWNTDVRDLHITTTVGFMARAVTFSNGPLSGDSHHLAVGGAKGHLKILNEADLRPVHNAHDSKEGILDLKFSPNSKYLAAATADMWVDIYSVTKDYSRIARCTGHSSSVRGLDWSFDSSVIQTDAADGEMLVWTARTGKQVAVPNRDLDFATYTLRLGFPVMGVWRPESTGDDINSCDRSKDRQLLVTADDDGMVKLFNYPCVIHDAPHRAYRGHSSFVQCARFNANDTRVCSVGAADWSMFQFKVVQLQPAEAPPPPAEQVWGPLDSSGKNFGWTTSPAQVAGGGAASRPTSAPSHRTSSAPPSPYLPADLSAAPDSLASRASRMQAFPEDDGAEDEGYSTIATSNAGSESANPSRPGTSATASQGGGRGDRPASPLSSRPISAVGGPPSSEAWANAVSRPGTSAAAGIANGPQDTWVAPSTRPGTAATVVSSYADDGSRPSTAMGTTAPQHSTNPSYPSRPTTAAGQRLVSSTQYAAGADPQNPSRPGTAAPAGATGGVQADVPTGSRPITAASGRPASARSRHPDGQRMAGVRDGTSGDGSGSRYIDVNHPAGDAAMSPRQTGEDGGSQRVSTSGNVTGGGGYDGAGRPVSAMAVGRREGGNFANARYVDDSLDGLGSGHHTGVADSYSYDPAVVGYADDLALDAQGFEGLQAGGGETGGRERATRARDLQQGTWRSDGGDF